jgi:hypothetical protein
MLSLTLWERRFSSGMHPFFRRAFAVRRNLVYTPAEPDGNSFLLTFPPHSAALNAERVKKSTALPQRRRDAEKDKTERMKQQRGGSLDLFQNIELFGCFASFCRCPLSIWMSPLCASVSRCLCGEVLGIISHLPTPELKQFPKTGQVVNRIRGPLLQGLFLIVPTFLEYARITFSRKEPRSGTGELGWRQFS